jgi:hypothetical protein
LKITLDSIENFYHLIQQRITQQNSGVLVRFTCLIQYQDGTSIELNNIDDLRIYTEVGPKISIGVALSWLYFIKFPDSSTPEPQAIDVWMECETGAIDFKNRNSGEFSSLKMRNSFERRYTGRISFRIAHTARTWGFDMENMLSSYIKNLFVSDDEPLRDVFRSNRTLFIWFSAVVGLLIAFMTAVQVGTHFAKKGYQKYVQMGELEDFSFLMKKIDLMSQDIQGKNIVWLQFGVSFTFVFTFIFFIYGFIGFIDGAMKEKPSFIIINEASMSFSLVEVKKYEKGWRNLVLSSISTVFFGVLGNVVSYFLI